MRLLEDVFGPGYIFHSRHGSVILFVYNTICTMEFSLCPRYFFGQSSVLDFFFQKIFKPPPPPPHKNQMIAPLAVYLYIEKILGIKKACIKRVYSMDWTHELGP